MWYFAWILGVGFAVLLAILNAPIRKVTKCGSQISLDPCKGSRQRKLPMHRIASW